MQADFYLTDDATLATALAFGPTAAGATSAAQILHLWNAKGTPGPALANMTIQAVDPATGLDSGLDWLDETWIEARINGGSNPGGVAAFRSVTTDWYRLGAGVLLPAPDLPGNCAYFLEVRIHPPLKDGAATETVNFKLVANYATSSLSLAGGLSDLGCGIVTGVGDPTAIEWTVAPTVLATATPDDVVHVSGARFYLNYGVPFTTTAQDDLTLNQNDGASAALTSAHEYYAVISQTPGVENAASVTKGLLAATGAGVVPALPAGDLLIAVVHVAYHATASVINQSDISTYATSGRGLPSIGTGLNVTIAALRAIMPGARIVNRSARTVAVPASLTSYLWLSSADQVTVNQSTTPPFAGAVLLCSVVTDGSSVTSLTDLRTYFSIDRGLVGVNTKAFTSASAAAVNIADVAVAPDSSTSGEITFELELSDGTDFSVLYGRFAYVAVSKAGTLSVEAAPTVFGSQTVSSSGGGTTGATATVTTGTNAIHLNIVPTWGTMTPTVKLIHWRATSTQANQLTIL